MKDMWLANVGMQAQKEASLIPPGMRILPEEERLEMLELLEQSQLETEEKLRVRNKILASC